MKVRESKSRAEHQASVLNRSPVNLGTYRGPSRADQAVKRVPPRQVWYFVLKGAKTEIIEEGGEYATEAEARAEGEAIKAGRRHIQLDPDPAKRDAANRAIGGFIARRKLLKEQAETVQRERSAQIARDAEAARASKTYKMLHAKGCEVLGDCTLIEKTTGGTRLPYIYGLDLLEAAGERLDEVLAVREYYRLKREDLKVHGAPWQRDPPRGKLARGHLALIATAHPHHPWRPEIV